MAYSPSIELKSRLRKLLDEDEVRTYGFLEKNFDIPKATVCRFLTGLTKNPHNRTVRKLENAVHYLESQNTKILPKSVIDSKLRKTWDDVNELRSGQELVTLEDQQVNLIMSTDITYQIWLVISTCGSLYYNRETISQAICGDISSELSILIESGIIVEEEGTGNFVAKFNKICIENPANLLKLNQIENRFFKLNMLGNVAAITRLNGRTSVKGIALAREIVYDAVKKLSKIQDEFPGDISFYTNSIFNIIDTKRYFESKENNDETNEND